MVLIPQRGEFGNTEYYQENAVSPATQERIDNEVRKIMETGLSKALALIKKNKKKLDEVAKALLKTETIDKEEFEGIVGKKQNGEQSLILEKAISK